MYRVVAPASPKATVSFSRFLSVGPWKQPRLLCSSIAVVSTQIPSWCHRINNNNLLLQPRSIQSLANAHSPQTVKNDNEDASASAAAPASRDKQQQQHRMDFWQQQVCDPLTANIQDFMQRRARVVTSRRQERQAVVELLQTIVRKCWPDDKNEHDESESCRLQPYGSCATGLDLVSSDLDLILVGANLDDEMEESDAVVGRDLQSHDSTLIPERENEEVEWKVHASSPELEALLAHEEPEQQQRPVAFSPSLPSFMLSKQYRAIARRVLQLAQELKGLPWIAKITTVTRISVPVLKIRVDLKQLPPDCYPAHDKNNDNDLLDGNDMNEIQWCGSDIMEGRFLSVDITINGPGHGGLGSSQYSQFILEQACQDEGKSLEHKDETAFVQCLVVLKEILHRRRLGSTFSGGVSGYGILLLLTALLRERKAIQQDILQKQVNTVNDTIKNYYHYAVVPPLVPKPSTTAIPTMPAANQYTALKMRQRFQAQIDRQMAMHEEQQQVLRKRQDLIQTLCTGELTSGKLLIHFLLFYGHLFDGRVTAIDMTGTYKQKQRQLRMMEGNDDKSLDDGGGGGGDDDDDDYYQQHTPFVKRMDQPTIDPLSGEIVLEPLLLYDPRPNAHENNIGRWSFAWLDVQWSFARMYDRLVDAAERQSSATAEPNAVQERAPPEPSAEESNRFSTYPLLKIVVLY